MANTANKKTKTDNIDYANAKNISQDMIETKLVTARIALMIKKPFFGNLATRLKITRADDWLPTAAVDGRNFYYNAAFIDALTPKETEFLFGHEVLHMVFEHLIRRDHRDPQLFNIACDFAVNQILADESVGEVIKTVPVLLDNKYRGKSSEEIYADLEEDWEKGKQEVRDMIQELLDEHDPWGDGGDGEDGDGEGKGKGKGRPSKLSDAEKKELKDEIREAMMNAAQSAGAGNVPGGVQRIIDELTEDPKMDWRELIQQQIQSLLKSDYSFARPSRKSWHTGCTLPGMIPDEMIDIAISIDMSGSISSQQAKFFLSEVKGIMDEFVEFKIKIWCFDTQVYAYQEFNTDTADEIYDYEPKGGGGTMFECNWEFMRENEIEPKRLILFTDGYPCGTWGEEDYCDTVFIIHGPENIKPAFGTYAHYNEGDE